MPERLSRLRGGGSGIDSESGLCFVKALEYSRFCCISNILQHEEKERMNRLATIVAVTGLAATSAIAQNAGDILFTSHGFQRSGGTLPDFIGLIDIGSLTSSNLYQVPNSVSDSRLSGIGRTGSGDFVFGNQPFPGLPGAGSTFRVNNLFSGTGTLNPLSSGGAADSPQEFAYHGPSNSMIVVNNPAGNAPPTNPTDGISAVNLATGVTTQLFAEPLSGPEPRYNAGVDIVADPSRAGSYYVLTFNRGVDGGFSDEAPSTLHRLTVNNDLTSVSVDLIQDFSASVVGAANAITRATSIAIDPTTGDVLVSANDGLAERKIVKVDIDGAGNSAGVSLFADIGAYQSTLSIGGGGVEEIEWDPFNNRWLLVEDIVAPNSPSRITTLGADGSIAGYGVLFDGGFAIRDIEVVPTPGAVGVLGLAGLMASRRRR